MISRLTENPALRGEPWPMQKKVFVVLDSSLTGTSRVETIYIMSICGYADR